MILLLLACGPLDETYDLGLVEPGGIAVSIPLRTVVFIPEDAVDRPVRVTLDATEGGDRISALDALGTERNLTLGDRLYTVTLGTDAPLDAPVWIGRWDPPSLRGGLGGTLYTAVDTEAGWEAQGRHDAPWPEVDAVLLHPDRAWVPTEQAVTIHGTAGTAE